MQMNPSFHLSKGKQDRLHVGSMAARGRGVSRIKMVPKDLTTLPAWRPIPWDFSLFTFQSPDWSFTVFSSEGWIYVKSFYR